MEIRVMICWRGRSRAGPEEGAQHGPAVRVGERAAVGMKIRLAAINGGVFKQARFQGVVAAQVGFVGVEHAVAVEVVARKQIEGTAVHQPQFVHGLKRGIFVRVTERRIIRRVIADAVGGAPVGDGGGEIQRHVGQISERVGAGGIQIQFGSLVHEPEIRLRRERGGSVAADEPEMRVAHRHGFGRILAFVRQGAVGGVIGKHVTNVARRAFDGLFRRQTAGAVVRGAEFKGHGMGEIKGNADQPDGNPQYQDEHRGAFAALQRPPRVFTPGLR